MWILTDLSGASVTGQLEMAVFDTSGAFTEVLSVDVRDNEKLNVTMDFDSLGGVVMEELYLTNNSIRAYFEFQYLPENIEIFECSSNELTLELSMNEMPKTLTHFICGDNSFAGFDWEPATNYNDDPYALTHLSFVCVFLWIV